jgi:S1-C subfamily serine protease
MKRLVRAIFASVVLSVVFSPPMAHLAKPTAERITAKPVPAPAPRTYTVPTSPYTVPLDSIIRIQCGQWSGTAEVIDGGTLLTASHVVAGNKQCTFVDAGVTRVMVVAYNNVKLDYAVLHTVTGKRKRIPINCNGFVTGQPYIAVGYAHGRDFAVQAAVAENGYSDSRDPKSGLEFNHTRALRGVTDGRPAAIPGMSGGPIFNLYGEIVGTTIASPKDDRDPHILARELKDTYLCQGKATQIKIRPQSK